MTTETAPDAYVAPDDRGLAYGDGLFETVLVQNGHAMLWEQHMARLQRGCERLGITAPSRQRLDALPAQAGSGCFVLKLILTRGSGGRGYALPDSPTPSLRWWLTPFTPQVQRWQGVRIRHCALQLGIQPRLAGLKHLNRLENVLARSEWQDADIAEGVLCDSEGQLVEATCMNLFWRRDGRLETPLLDRCGVAGTLREALLQRLAIDQVRAGPEMLEQAEAVWLANSVQGVWPVVRLDDSAGRALAHWTLGRAHDALQAEGHALLGYPHQPNR